MRNRIGRNGARSGPVGAQSASIYRAAVRSTSGDPTDARNAGIKALLTAVAPVIGCDSGRGCQRWYSGRRGIRAGVSSSSWPTSLKSCPPSRPANALMVKADARRVSPGWLLGFFALATLGELCLSPVGLSVVSQLAPARFATLLMGVWLLTFAFNFLAGACGERWGTWSPLSYFTVAAAGPGVVSLVLWALVRPIRPLMHGAG
jgi:POT family